MTRIVHTADVHLRAGADERWTALRSVLELAAARDATVATIGGDLFDRPEDVETLRNQLREDLFTSQPFEVLLIPGNHDMEAFRGDLFFGDSCTVLTAPDDPFDTWVSPGGELRIVGLPYQDVATDELLLALNDRAPFDGTDVLLFHGSLDAPVGADPGNESARRYFPVTETELAGLDFDYYLAGHYHGAHQRQFDTGAWFAYPGTPASTRRSETGRRQAVTLGPDAGLDFTPLETFHHRAHDVTITPGEEETALETIADWVTTHTTPHAELSITVEGLIDMPETEFATRLAEVAGPAEVTNRTASVDAIIDHQVLVEMRTRLDERDWDDETTKAVWLRTLRAASTVYSSRGGL